MAPQDFGNRRQMRIPGREMGLLNRPLDTLQQLAEGKN
jgi:hypothetical protein